MNEWVVAIAIWAAAAWLLTGLFFYRLGKRAEARRRNGKHGLDLPGAYIE